MFILFYCAICYLQFFSFIQNWFPVWLTHPRLIIYVRVYHISLKTRDLWCEWIQNTSSNSLKIHLSKSFFGCNTHNNTQRLQLKFHGCKKGEYKKKKMKQRNHQRQQNAYIWRKCINFYIFFSLIPYFKCDKNIFFWWRNIIHEHRLYFFYFFLFLSKR